MHCCEHEWNKAHKNVKSVCLEIIYKQNGPFGTHHGAVQGEFKLPEFFSQYHKLTIPLSDVILIDLSKGTVV